MKTKQDYTNFRASLTTNSKQWDFETKEELKKLMSIAGYRIVFDKETKTRKADTVTDAQVNFAWNFLKGKEQKFIDDYTVHTYNKIIHLRANKEITIKGKKYRKGQFIPKKRD